ncbi:hypothetical protein E2C01_096372 [Portunus trituberculatus]|uniref:Uncharacterized protein n=1 Tax=Portunus trituberculatus TaxID=210409 RepID=A0A5B7K2U0_PORTR|nr:hypothetical protein [Portunus trituberculatus]
MARLQAVQSSPPTRHSLVLHPAARGSAQASPLYRHSTDTLGLRTEDRGRVMSASGRKGTGPPHCLASRPQHRGTTQRTTARRPLSIRLLMILAPSKRRPGEMRELDAVHS